MHASIPAWSTAILQYDPSILLRPPSSFSILLASVGQSSAARMIDCQLPVARDAFLRARRWTENRYCCATGDKTDFIIALNDNNQTMILVTGSLFDFSSLF